MIQIASNVRVYILVTISYKYHPSREPWMNYQNPVGMTVKLKLTDEQKKLEKHIVMHIIRDA